MNKKINLSLTMEQIELVKHELQRNRALEALNGIRQPRQRRTWQNMIDEAEALYGCQKRLGGLREKLLRIWAMTWYYIFAALQTCRGRR